MRHVIRKLAIAAILVTTVTSCASIRRDLLADQWVTLETTPVDDVTYLYTNIEQKGVHLYVFGRVALKDPKTARNAPGHLDITFINADGEVIWIDHAPYKQYHHTGYRNQVQYNAEARILADEGMKVLLTHHFAAVAVHDGPNGRIL